MKKKIKLTESDLENIIKRVLNEQSSQSPLCPVQCKTKVLGKGNAGEDVKLIQNALAKCGFNKEKFGGGMKVGCDKDHTKCDGKFNTETAKAVREFQKSVGITMDGLVGPKTLAKLMESREEKDPPYVTPCLKPFECNCKKKTDKISDQEQSVTDGGADSMLNITDKVTVGCKKSISCFEKHKNDACGLANCLGICIPDGMCKGKYDRPKNIDSACKGCPKYIWTGYQVAGGNAQYWEKKRFNDNCLKNKCSIGTNDQKKMKGNETLGTKTLGGR